MAQRKVIWTKTADLQFVGILEYWHKRNKSNVYSKKLIKLVSNKTNQIAKNPFAFKSTDIENIRVAIFENFSIFFKHTDDQIIITAMWDNRQDPKKLLDILIGKG